MDLINSSLLSRKLNQRTMGFIENEDFFKLTLRMKNSQIPLGFIHLVTELFTRFRFVYIYAEFSRGFAICDLSLSDACGWIVFFKVQW